MQSAIRTQELRVNSVRFLRICFLFIVAIATNGQNSSEAPREPRWVHVYVALADNEHQGIIPVPKVLGNGDDAARNLYWGAAFGVRTYFRRSTEWREVSTVSNPTAFVLERSVFYRAQGNIYLIAEAYRGSEIRKAIEGFFQAAAGLRKEELASQIPTRRKELGSPVVPDLVVYVGHDGLMDFQLHRDFRGGSNPRRQAIVLACASKQFFGPNLHATGAEPLLWTTGLMAPEAYTLKAALDGWSAGESNEQIRRRAADAYAHYQKIGQAGARRLFASGW